MAEKSSEPAMVVDDAKSGNEVGVESVSSNDDNSPPAVIGVPLSWKLTSILLVSAIGFGSHWSSGITGAMKSTIKRKMKINNTKFALLDASEDFMVTVLMLLSGLVTDKIGGAGAILYGNIIITIGSILVAASAQTLSYKLMIVGRVIQALGDISTQIAQYKIFSSWFPPNHGFASTLGLELGIGKIGAFVGKSSANIISKNTGNFANVFWAAVGINVFTNLMTGVFYLFTRYANKKFIPTADPATGEKLTEKSERWNFKAILELPWVFWVVMLFSLFETSTAVVFSQNATELAEMRLGISNVTAGWYTSLMQYGGFFIVPLLGIFIDLYGNRISILAFCGAGVFTAMCLVNWTTSLAGTSTAFGIYAFAFCFGPTTIIDSIRTSIWDQNIFGSAYAIKITMNNAMNIIVRVITGRLQDADSDSYTRVTIVYVFLAACSVAVSIALIAVSFRSIDLRRLQWTRKQRVKNGTLINERKDVFEGENGERNRGVSKWCFGALCALVVGSWVGYFWGVAAGKSY
ncbi:hypothetical protein HYALB_00008854 [Hymenoscyphus albidus]|uniref:Lysosomal dipeptide transporter MFSD1 n=1 Tax=Hymenoscyphus albidus TaxID=595503 RepID=A0A9N9LMG8_9HELO|nr:hypothetical protein HYALB_00008854 [Hymenoscyphus albidus]